MFVLVCKRLMCNLHVFILLFIPSPLFSFIFFLSIPFFFLFSALSLQIQLYMYASMHVSKYPLSNVLLCVTVSTPFQSLFSSPIVSLKSSSCLFILNFFISSLYLTLKNTCIFLLFLSVPSHLLCLLNPCLFPSLSSFFLSSIFLHSLQPLTSVHNYPPLLSRLFLFCLLCLD